MAQRAACLGLVLLRCVSGFDSPACATTNEGYQDLSVPEANGNVTPDNATACQQECANAASCALFTWYTSTGACWLYKDGTPAVALEGVVSGPAVCPTTETGTTPSTSTMEFGDPTIATTTAVPIRIAPPLSAASCLLWYGDGCAKITDKDLCLSTRDGRPYKDWKQKQTVGQPCVWCGGFPCEVNSTSLCMPYDWVKDSYAEPTSSLQVATCEFAKPLPKQSLESPERTRNVTFNRIGNVCRGATITDSANFKYNYYWIWTATTLEQCQTFCDHKEMCTGIEYKAKDNYCEVWWKPMNWSDSTTEQGSDCYRANAPPTWDRKELSCLPLTSTALTGGCGDLQTQDQCLKSRDGRELVHWQGYRIRGQPCVWCQGKPCTDKSDKLCEPQDWLENGQGSVFDTFLAEDSYAVANCSSHAATTHPLGRFVTGDGGMDVFWLPPSGTQKHLVPPELDCEACGCKKDVETVEPTYLQEMAQAATFQCGMIPKVSGDRDLSPPEIIQTTSIAETTEAPDIQGGDGSWPMWVWFVIGVLLCGVVAVGVALSGVLKGKAAKKKPVKRRHRGANVAATEEETAALINNAGDSADKPAGSPKDEEQFPGYAMAPQLPMQYLPSFFGPQPVMQPQPFVQYAPLAPSIQHHPQVMMQQHPMHVAYGPGAYAPGAPPHFDTLDRNHDGVISRQEFVQAYNAPAEPVGSLRPFEVVQGVDQRLAGVSRGMAGQDGQDSQTCFKCGNMLMVDSRFCRKCGTPRGVG